MGENGLREPALRLTFDAEEECCAEPTPAAYCVGCSSVVVRVPAHAPAQVPAQAPKHACRRAYCTHTVGSNVRGPGGAAVAYAPALPRQPTDRDAMMDDCFREMIEGWRVMMGELPRPAGGDEAEM